MISLVDQVIEREHAGPSGDQEDQFGGPGELIGPASRMDQELDRQGHGQRPLGHKLAIFRPIMAPEQLDRAPLGNEEVMITFNRIAVGAILALTLVLGTAAGAVAQNESEQEQTFGKNEILNKAANVFGGVTEGLAKIIEKVFKEQGRPAAYIAGEEVSGAIGIGLRYGNGRLHRKAGQSRKVYWQGPSIGFDFGGNASKVFVLIYHLTDGDSLFQRFPGVDGSLYFIAGFGVNYQQTGKIILAPIRTGVGARAGINIGYLHYTKEYSLFPL